MPRLLNDKVGEDFTMCFIKFRWRYCLFLLTILLMVPVLVAGCGGQSEEEKPTIRLCDQTYETHWLMNALTKVIFEEGYGYPVESVMLSVPVSQIAVASGEIDIWFDAWYWYYTEWWDEVTEKGEIEVLGISMEPCPSFWIIPQWVHEEYNINTIEDMKEHWELFKDPEDPTKGLFINCPMDWNCNQINPIKLEGYGLVEYYNYTAASAGALEATLAGAQKKHEPVFGYYWAPTALMGMFDWYVLEEPEYDPDVWHQIMLAMDDPSLRPLDAACAWEALSPVNVIWSGLRDKAPNLIPVIEKINVGLEPTNKASAWAKENEVEDWEEVAIWYLREYDSRWKDWVTSEAYTKIKEFVDGYGTID